MAGKQAYSSPQSANISIENMKSALPRLERRLEELRAFDPTQIEKRDDPTVRVLGNAIDDFLTRTFGKETVEYNRYSSAIYLDTASVFLGQPTPLDEVIEGLQDGKGHAIEILEGIKRTFLEEIDLSEPATIDQEVIEGQPSSDSREVFVVHGSDHGTRDTVARFLEQLDVVPIILDEEASKGRTIHQKFRDHSSVAYAVGLFTPDDEGKPAGSLAPLKPRPRQNVVYELGFFLAKLGDTKVCVLYSDGVEIPSDLSGVIYISLDKDGAWKLRLAKEMRAAGIEIDMNKA